MRLKALIFFGIFSLVSFGFSDMMDFQLHQLPYQLHTKEELLPLYAQWLYPNKDSIGRNIKWLELAYIAYFDDPIKALVPIKSEIQYKRYQNLLMMHICVLLTQEYINYGYQFFKENVYYYNTGYLDEYLKGFDIAEYYFTQADQYWRIAVDYAQKADAIKGVTVNPNCEIYNFDMEDEMYRIKSGDLKYYKSIPDLLSRLYKNREQVKAMKAQMGK